MSQDTGLFSIKRPREVGIPLFPLHPAHGFAMLLLSDLLLTLANSVFGPDAWECTEFLCLTSTIICNEAYQLDWRLSEPSLHLATHALNVAT
jgi:hypothetical protein